MDDDEFRDFCARILGWTSTEDGESWMDDEENERNSETWKPQSSLNDFIDVERKVVSSKGGGGLGLGGRYFDALSKATIHEFDYVEKSLSADVGQIDFTITIYTDYIAQLIASPLEARRSALEEIETDIKSTLKQGQERLL